MAWSPNAKRSCCNFGSASSDPSEMGIWETHPKTFNPLRSRAKNVGNRKPEMTIEEKFWSFVNLDGPIPKNDSSLGNCWIWKGHVETKGYAQFFTGGKYHRAHRWIYQKVHGKLKKSEFVCHKCHDKLCVRDSHHYNGSAKDNSQDNVKVGNVTSTLNADDVLLIRNSLDAKISTIGELAKEFKITFQSVYQIATGKTWSHVGGPRLKRRLRPRQPVK